MAKNGAKGGGREGSVTGRTQFKNPNTDLYQKRDSNTGRWVDIKTTGGPFKGVRRERSPISDNIEKGATVSPRPPKRGK